MPSGSPDPDGDLVPALQSGDERAFETLMTRHLKTIHALAFHMLGDQFAAEDVAQSVFLKTWQMMPRWVPGRARLLTWMRRVATNLCLDILRKKKPVYMETLPEIIDSADMPDHQLGLNNERKKITAALGALPERQRAALTLSYYQNVSQVEGAQIMDISVSAYESLLVRARKALRAVIENEAGSNLEMGVGS